MVADAYFCLPQYVGNIDLYIDHFVNSPCHSYSALTKSIYLSLVIYLLQVAADVCDETFKLD